MTAQIDLLALPGAGTFPPGNGFSAEANNFKGDAPMHGIIYLIGLIVVIMFLLSLLGLR